MKISINRANKIRNTLEKSEITLGTAIILRTDADMNEAKAAYLGAKETISENFDKVIEHIGHIQKMRDLINRANDTFEITPIISKIAHTERLIKTLKSLGGNGYGRTTTFAEYDMAKRHRDALSNADPTKAPAPQNVTVDAGEDLRENIKVRLAGLKLELNELIEQRNNKNHNNIIELPAELIEFLKSESLLAA